MGCFYGLLLMVARLLLPCLRLATGKSYFHFLPVHGCLLQLQQTDTADRWLLVLNGFQGFAVEATLGSVYPKAMGEACRLTGFVQECFVGSGKKGIYRRLVYPCAPAIALALNGPVAAVMCLRHKVYARIFAAKVGTRGELFPQPHVAEQGCIHWVGLQIGLHQAFKACAFVTFGERERAESFKKGM